MRLDIGPFFSAGGHEWITQARFVTGLVRKGAPLPFAVPPEVLDEFEAFYDEWEQALESDPFVWSREVDLVLLRPLMTYWFNLAQMLADHPEYQPKGSMEARAFYRNLVAGVLAEVVRQAPEEFEALQERWPPL